MTSDINWQTKCVKTKTNNKIIQAICEILIKLHTICQYE